MFITPDNRSNILDTCKLEANGIALKPFHALRTFEAYQLIHKIIDFKKILLIYDNLEQQLLRLQLGEKIIRIIFSYANFTYTFEILDYLPLQIPVVLELTNEPKQPSGLGLQNYKWENRQFWENLLSFKLPSAFDVISVNEKNELVETSRFNLFLYDHNKNLMLTPPLSTGCVNGVYRRMTAQQGYIVLPGLGKKQFQEQAVATENISDYQLFVANSVRGVVSAELVC